MRARRWAAAALAGAAIAVGVRSGRTRGHAVDLAAFRAVNAGTSPSAERALGAVTELGSLWASVGAAVTLAAAGRRRPAAHALAAAGVAWLAGQGLKRVFDRPRPYQAYEDVRLLIGEPPAASWPSSHPMVLTAFTDVAARRLGLGPSVRAGLAVLSGIVGVSRSALGAHYPSDVIGGLLLGRAIALAWPDGGSDHGNREPGSR
jgi:membrane-associated phospholipid phosphatase